MAQYIDKDAVMAEIERIKKEECPITTYEGRIKLFYFEQFLSFLDTLEVKEVDLKKKLSYDDYKKFFKEYPNISDDCGFEEAWTCAEYFFELGLKTADLPT